MALFTEAGFQMFKTAFISIILEAIPFVLLGVLLSSVLQIFVSEKTIQRWTPKNPVLGVLFACGLGILFPVCECGLIPVVRRLIRKGMPAHVGMTFMIAGPVLNPVVYAATYMAFRSNPMMAHARMGLAFAVAFAVGLILARELKGSNPLKNEKNEHEHSHEHGNAKQNKFSALLSHAGDEFFEMGKFLVLGSFIAALIQSSVPRESLTAIGGMPAVSNAFMMGFSYILSLCSTSDAFVASSFVTTFSSGSLLAFMVFGPMLDFKSTLMLLSTFKTKVVLLFCALIAAATLLGSILVGSLFFQ